jgi:hypothetical protein
MPTTASADRASAALEELTEALKNPAAAKPFLNTSNKLNATIEALTEILTIRSTTPANSEPSPPRVSERTTAVRTPRVNNNARAVSAPRVTNDPKLALRPKSSPQLAVRSLNKIISMHANPTLNTTNNIKKATSITKPAASIPTELVYNNNNIKDNNYINGADTGIQNKENNPN